MAWSRLSPASMQMTSRSRTSGRPRRILPWRFLILVQPEVGAKIAKAEANGIDKEGAQGAQAA